MAEVNLNRLGSELVLSFPNLFGDIEKLESMNVSDPQEKLVESGVRRIICEQLARLPQFKESPIDIMVYRGLRGDTPTAIEFRLDSAASDAIGWADVCAKVFISDRKEYEPRLFDILPTEMS